MGPSERGLVPPTEVLGDGGVGLGVSDVVHA
jgi:hypothetical protein